MNRPIILPSLAHLVIIITGLKIASNIILPLLMALFLFILFLPLAKKLQSIGIPDIITTIIVFMIILSVIVIISVFLVSSGQDIVSNIDTYQEKFNQLHQNMISYFDKHGIFLEQNNIIPLFEPAKIINFMASFIQSMSDILTNSFVTLLIVIFLFLESSQFSQKLLLVLNERERVDLNIFFKNINGYFLTKTITSLGTGILVWALLLHFNLHYALLFGILAFLLNYIPNIGSIMAAIPALLIALLQLTLLETLFIAIGYLIINMSIGNFIEPKLMGEKVGLSTLVIFLSMIVWGWIFGPIGMFLSVPLTLIIKLAVENSKKYYWISIFLSNQSVKDKTLKQEEK